MTRVIKVTKKTLESFKNARGINDLRRIGKIYTCRVKYNYFCNTFLPDLEYCESEKDINWVCDMITGEMFDNEMFDNEMDDIHYLQIYWVKEQEQEPAMSRLCWRLPGYSERGQWKDVYYNTSSIFAANLCQLEDEDGEESD